MRLICTSTLTLHEFIGEHIPSYAILSHTWGPRETTYQEMMATTGTTPQTEGYNKVVRFAKLCKALNHQYCWVDTCC
ncbi:hypothetical protein P154DRAFT_417423, partial [Amniculicola lignicola CBS 123094]